VDGAAPPPRDLTRYAAKQLARRLKTVLAPGADIGDLPAAELHAIRLHGKRLRYAAEFFAPLFPGRHSRRFVRRLAALQERLGTLNDGAVAASLMAEIGQERGYAGGVVRGLVAAGSQGARRRIGRSWKRLLKLEPFWE
jgi:CHAD domain-containing protein